MGRFDNLLESRFVYGSILIVIFGIALGSAYFLQFQQGQFFGDEENPCQWIEATHPETNQTYSTISEFKSAWMEYADVNESVAEARFADAEIEVRDGTVYTRGSCSLGGTVGT